MPESDKFQQQKMKKGKKLLLVFGTKKWKSR